MVAGKTMKLAAALAVAMTIAAACICEGASAVQLPPRSLDPTAIRQVLERAMRCQSVRQLHAAVVHRNSELYSVKLELQPDGQIKEITDTKLLYLASISKGMFGTALVRLEQHLRTVLNNQSFSLFNTPIKQLIGDDSFWFLDHGRSELVTIDDLLSHRTGLARHDALWYLHEWQSKEDLVKHVGRLKASAEFRGSLVYNNLVWTIADVVAQKLTNRSSFVNYMREFLWHPLGMADTHGSSEMKENPMLSRRMDTGRFDRPLGLPLEMSKMEHATRFVEAAGGIMSSLPDVMKYMRLHASHNYSAYQPVPGQFRLLNALAAEGGANIFFSKQFYNDDVTDLPEWEIESYGRGWMRTWYRDHLDYSHGGSLLGVRCELDVFPKQNLAVFNHMTLGPSAGAPLQTFYSAIINKYIADLLIRNQSFVNEDNVCALLKNISDASVARIPRRHLTGDEVNELKGSYGNYGFGTAEVTYNQTSKTASFMYGFAVVELIPVVLLPEQKEPYHFFNNLLEPLEFTSSGTLLNRTDEAIYVPGSAQQNPSFYLTISRDPTDKQLVMQAAVLEVGMLLRKGLDPGTWKRPKLCPEGKLAPKSILSSTALVAVAAAVALSGNLFIH